MRTIALVSYLFHDIFLIFPRRKVKFDVQCKYAGGIPTSILHFPTAGGCEKRRKSLFIRVQVHIFYYRADQKEHTRYCRFSLSGKIARALFKSRKEGIELFQ